HDRDEHARRRQHSDHELKGPEALDAVRDRAVQHEQDREVRSEARECFGNVERGRQQRPTKKGDHPRERVRCGGLQAMQPYIDDVSERGERSADVQERHLLQQREELLRPREDEDDQQCDAGQSEHDDSPYLASELFFASVSARERFATAMHRAGALQALMQLRRIAPGPSTVSILTYHHVAAEDTAYPYDAGV